MPHRNRRPPCRSALERLEPRTLFSSAFTNINISKMKGNQAEGAIAVDPVDPSKMFAVSNIDTGDGLMAATTSDGGTTWSATVIAKDNSALPAACCDPSAAFDSFGNLFLTYLNSSDNQVELLLSTDAGHSFTLLTQFNGNVDQPTVVTGTGSVWLDFDRGNGVSVTGAPVVSLGSVGSFQPLQQVPGSANGQFGDIAVGPSGQVMVTWQSDTSAHHSQMKVNVDPTGLGGKFGKAVLVGATNVPKFDYIPAQNTRGIDAETGLAFDTSGGPFTGRAYLVYTDEYPAASGNTDIYVRYSDNNGATWSAPIRVNDDDGANSQFLPRIKLDPTTGQVAVSWYDARNDLGPGASGDVAGMINTDAEFYATVITPQADGLLVSPNQQVAAAPSDAFDANSTIDFGDYTGLDFYGGTLHPLWFDNSNSTRDNPNKTLNQLNAYTADVPASSFAGAPKLSLGQTADPAGPLVSLTSGAAFNPDFIRAGRYYTITVTFSADTDPSTITNSDLLVTGPNGFDQPAQLVRTVTLRGGVRRATYRVSKPTGNWTSADIGTYTINLEPGAVADTTGQPATDGILGDFVVATGLAARNRGGTVGTRHHPRNADD
ncbi:MAG TPA: sialidase family protein [Tepidisphaeraceae bacterium]